MVATRRDDGAWRSYSNWDAGFQTTHFGPSGISPNPVSVRIALNRRAFWWGLPHPWTEAAERDFLDAARQVGIACAISIPVFDRIGLASVVHFTSPDDAPDLSARDVLVKLAEMYNLFQRTQAYADDDAGDGAATDEIAAAQIPEQWSHRVNDTARSIANVYRFCFKPAAWNRPSSSEAAQPLSPREIEFLKWASQGSENWQIGEILQVSTKTVEAAFRNIFKKLHVQNKTAAVVAAVKAGYFWP